MSRRQEWDWPHEGRQRYHIDATPPRTGWASPTATKVVNGYVRGVLFVFKMVAGAFLGVAFLACIWLIVTLLQLWK